MLIFHASKKKNLVPKNRQQVVTRCGIEVLGMWIKNKSFNCKNCQKVKVLVK